MNYPLDLIINERVQHFYLPGSVSVNDSENYVICALRGLGMIQVPRYHVAEKLKTGELVEILSDWQVPDMAVSALYSGHRQLSPRVRVFIDWLVQIYRDIFS